MTPPDGPTSLATIRRCHGSAGAASGLGACGQRPARSDGSEHPRVMSDEHWEPRCAPPLRLVRPVRVDPAGQEGPTKAQAVGPHWRRTSRNLYVPVTVDGGVPEQRIVEQAARVAPHGVVTGWAACRLLGARYFDGLEPDGRTPRPVLAIPGPGSRTRSGAEIVVTREPLRADEIYLRAGIRVTEPRRALFDEMRQHEDWREATVAFDMMAAAGLVSLRQMGEYLAARTAWRRSSTVTTALAHGSEHSRSPNECRMRLVWEVDAGLPRPLVNKEIFSRSGRLVAVADLLDPVAGVVGEYDGAAHLRTRRRHRDVLREEALRRLQLEYFDVMHPDLASRDVLAERMRSTRDRARFLSVEERPWTMEPPPGWRREPSLDERLFLLEMDRRAEREMRGEL